MSYATYSRLPGVNSYEDALARTKVAPIRGAKPLSYPLGERKNHRAFSIRIVGDEASKPNAERYKPAPTAKDGDVELLHYWCPVITLHKPAADTPQPTHPPQPPQLTLMAHKYWSTADCRFILELLYGYITDTRTSKGRLILLMRNGERIVVPKGGCVTLNMNVAERTLKPVDPQAVAHTVLRLNRPKANAVRKTYGEFFRYLKGMVGVRKYYDRQQPQAYLINIPSEEIRGVVPTESVEPVQGLRSTVPVTPLTKVRYAQKYSSYGALGKPPKLSARYTYSEVTNKTEVKYIEEPYKAWLSHTTELLTLCRTPADDPEQFEKFRQAFVWLAFYTHAPYLRIDRDVILEDWVMAERFNEIIFKYHSEEVFERVLAKPGSVPSTKYDKWVTRDKE